MKKLFVFLMVTFIAMAGLFAAPDTRTSVSPSDAQITITAQITALYPHFTLSTTGSNVETKTATEDTDQEAALTSDAAASLAEGTNVTVAFAIKQADTAKVKNAYTLTVTATPLALVEFIDADGNVVATPPTANEIALNTFALATGSDAPTIGGLHAAVVKNSVTVGSFSSVGNVLTATYNGTVKTTDLSDTTLGTFSVEYVGNDENAPGNYESTVTLEIAAV